MMLQETARPFTAGEQRLLRRRGVIPKLGTVYWMPNWRRRVLWTAIIVGSVIGIGHLVGYSVPAYVAAGVFAYISYSDYRERVKVQRAALSYREKLREELEGGLAHSILCRPKRIIEREEFEDEGALWIFDGGDGKYLAICGQDHYATPRFPSAEFEVVLGSRNRTLIGIRLRGMRMASTLVVTEKEIPWDAFPTDAITIFAAPANAELPVLVDKLRESGSALK
jgi:hypothetical protein